MAVCAVQRLHPRVGCEDAVERGAADAEQLCGAEFVSLVRVRTRAT